MALRCLDEAAVLSDSHVPILQSHGLLAFELPRHWDSSNEPVVEQNTIETFAVTYSYDIRTGSGNRAWTVESTTMTNFMAACTTRKISHYGSAGPTTVIGTWYRGTKDLTWAETCM